MGQAIIVRGGTIGVGEIRKNQKEVTTADTVVSLSVFVGEVKDIRREEELWEVAEGYPGKTMDMPTNVPPGASHPDIAMSWWRTKIVAKRRFNGLDRGSVAIVTLEQSKKPPLKSTLGCLRLTFTCADDRRCASRARLTSGNLAKTWEFTLRDRQID